MTKPAFAHDTRHRRQRAAAPTSKRTRLGPGRASARATQAHVSAAILRRVAELRTERRWTVRELARRLTDAGYPTTADSLYAAATRRRRGGQGRVSADMLVGYAAVFDTDVQALLGEFAATAGEEPR